MVLGVHPKLKVHHRGSGLGILHYPTNGFLGAHLSALGYKNLGEVGIDGEVVSVAYQNHLACAGNVNYRGDFALKHGAHG